MYRETTGRKDKRDNGTKKVIRERALDMSNPVRSNADIPALLAVSWAARRLSLACVRDSSFALACILMYDCVSVREYVCTSVCVHVCVSVCVCVM